LFEKLDEDQKGYLTIDKIKKGIEELMHMEESKSGKKKVACKHPPDEYEKMMQGMDRDGDGKVTWDEFVTAAIDKISLLNDGNIRAAFNVLDADGNGRITKKELKDKFASSDKN
jgi:calcium-dependent protein kinase